MRKVKMTMGDLVLEAEVLDTPTADAIWGALPIEGSANTWGDEVYFSTPVSADQEPEARDVMEPGDIAYWPPGSAIAIAYGPTPVSQGSELRLASPSNVRARALGDVTTLRAVAAGTPVKVEAGQD